MSLTLLYAGTIGRTEVPSLMPLDATPPEPHPVPLADAGIEPIEPKRDLLLVETDEGEAVRVTFNVLPGGMEGSRRFNRVFVRTYTQGPLEGASLDDILAARPHAQAIVPVDRWGRFNADVSVPEGDGFNLVLLADWE